MAPELDTFNSLEGISPAFDPSRVLLRRIFFIRANKNKYVSTVFYSTRNYQPLVEIGDTEKKPLILTSKHVRVRAENLPRQCEDLCKDEYYVCKDGDFKINTAGKFRIPSVSR